MVKMVAPERPRERDGGTRGGYREGGTNLSSEVPSMCHGRDRRSCTVEHRLQPLGSGALFEYCAWCVGPRRPRAHVGRVRAELARWDLRIPHPILGAAVSREGERRSRAVDPLRVRPTHWQTSCGSARVPDLGADGPSGQSGSARTPPGADGGVCGRDCEGGPSLPLGADRASWQSHSARIPC